MACFKSAGGRSGGGKGARKGGSGKDGRQNTKESPTTKGGGGAGGGAAAKPQTAAKPKAQTASAAKAPVNRVDQAVTKLRNLQKVSDRVPPHRIDATVHQITSKLKGPEMAQVQRQYLGVSMGGSKAKQRAQLAKKIHDFRESKERVAGIMALN